VKASPLDSVGHRRQRDGQGADGRLVFGRYGHDGLSRVGIGFGPDLASHGPRQRSDLGDLGRR
jgi:hypothetical protein